MSLDHWYIYGAGGLGIETMDILQSAIRRGLQSLTIVHSSSIIRRRPRCLGFRSSPWGITFPAPK